MNTLDQIVPGLIQWRTSEPVPVLDRPERPERTHAVVVPEVLKSALDAIPNTGDAQLDYDEWRNVVFAVHGALGDDGLDLAHEFSSRASCYDSDFLDSRVWPYIRDDRPDGITERTIYSIAARYGWQDPTLIDDFDVVPVVDDFDVVPVAAADEAPAVSKWVIERASAFIAHEPKPDIIKGVLPAAGLGVIFGESGAGKTFMALDIAGCIARGVQWRDRPVVRGRVLYICAEGEGGFRKRLAAYMRMHGLADIEILVLAGAPNFMEAADIRELLLAAIAAGPFSMIVVDTFAQVMPGANENSGEDVGLALKHCKVLHAKTRAMVLLVHHSGKDASRGARGWSGLRAAADCELEVTRADQNRVMAVTKLKDGEDGAEFGFKLNAVPTGGIDAEGEPVMSCVVEHTAVTKAAANSDKIGGIERAVIDHLEDAGGTLEVDVLLGLIEAERRGAGKPAPRRDSFDRTLATLAHKKRIVRDASGVHLAGSELV